MLSYICKKRRRHSANAFAQIRLKKSAIRLCGFAWDDFHCRQHATRECVVPDEVTLASVFNDTYARSGSH
jgi:hypothetical protein